MTTRDSKVSAALGQIRAGQEQILEAFTQIRQENDLRLLPEMEEIFRRQSAIMSELEQAFGIEVDGDETQ